MKRKILSVFLVSLISICSLTNLIYAENTEEAGKIEFSKYTIDDLLKFSDEELIGMSDYSCRLYNEVVNIGEYAVNLIITPGNDFVVYDVDEDQKLDMKNRQKVIDYIGVPEKYIESYQNGMRELDPEYGMLNGIRVRLCCDTEDIIYNEKYVMQRVIMYCINQHEGRYDLPIICKNESDMSDINSNGNDNSTVLGDINFDGEIDITDLSELSLTVLGDSTLSEEQTTAADIDGDGDVTIADMSRLKQYVSNQISSLR